MTESRCIEEMPRKLKIGAYDWKVVVNDTVGSECYGQASFEASTITIWPASLTSTSHIVGTVFHECLHVIFDNHDLAKMKKSASEREEKIILGFESGMISLLRDNPKFVTWMRKWLR